VSRVAGQHQFVRWYKASILSGFRAAIVRTEVLVRFGLCDLAQAWGGLQEVLSRCKPLKLCSLTFLDAGKNYMRNESNSGAIIAASAGHNCSQERSECE
jgi:hypothetical protein